MGEYTFEVYLTQHTPMLHFQHAQSGVTLRATEVKPKLDKYLGKVCAEELNKNNNWFLKDTKALNYKMRITALQEPTISKAGKHTVDAFKIETRNRQDPQIRNLNAQARNAINGLYFGNMVSKNDSVTHERKSDEQFTQDVQKSFKETIMYAPRALKLTIICFIPELMELIKANIENFFIVENFGTRQNKGFGSFTLADKKYSDEDVATALCQYYGAKACYCFNGGNNALDKIKTVYSIIKSGLNFNNRNQYRHSLLFNYMNENGITNEKAFLKQQGMAPSNIGPNARLAGRNANHQNPKKYYVRALLGVGDHVEFITQLSPMRKANVKMSSPNIARYQSPILFKVIDGKVYYVGKRIDPEIFNKKFSFYSLYSRSGCDIYTPEKDGKINENFLDDFLKYCCKALNDSRPCNNETPLQDFANMRGTTIKEVLPRD